MLLFAALTQATPGLSQAQQGWYEVAASTLPTSTDPLRAAHHEVSNSLLVGTGGINAETWTRVGCQWGSAAGPQVTSQTEMVYQSFRGVTVMARNEGLRFGMYEYNGAWTRKNYVGGASGRKDFGLGYDFCGTDRIILFGGLANSSTTALGDTQSWDGTSWVLETPAVSPSARYGHAMANASGGGYGVLVHGGVDSVGNTLSDTWIGNNCGPNFSWLALAAQGPPALSGHTLTPAGIDAVLMAGGTYANGQASQEVWRFDFTNSSWTRWPDLPMAFNGRVSLAFNRFTDRLWVWGVPVGQVERVTLMSDPAAVFAEMPLLEYGPGCSQPNPPSTLTVTSDSCTAINSTMIFDIAGSTQGGSLLMGLSDQATGSPMSCAVHLAGNIVTAPGVAGPAGFSMPIPNDVTLIGSSFYLQGIELATGRTTTSTLIRVCP